MAFKMKGMHHGEGTGSSKAFRKASAFKEVPGGGESVQDKIRRKRAERAGEKETKTHKLFGRTWEKTKEFDEEGRKVGKQTIVRDRYGKEIGRQERGTLEGYKGGDSKESNKESTGTFDEAFAAHRKKMIAEHGSGPDAYDKWTNFIWSGDKTGGEERQFHPYTGDDIGKGADKTKSIPLAKKAAFKNYKTPRDYEVFNMGNRASAPIKKKKKGY